MSINTNLNALAARRQINESSNDLNDKLEKLASGLRINTAADDAAGLAISTKMASQVRGGSQALQNLQDGLSMLQTAEGATAEIQSGLQRARELAVRSANGTFTSEDRSAIQDEINQITDQIDRIAEDTQFNEKNLLNGEISSSNGGAEIQAGADESETLNLNISDLSSSALGVDGADVSSQSNASDAIGNIDGALNQVATERADLGAAANEIKSSVDSTLIERQNQAAAQSRIEDANMAQAATERAQASILSQAGTSALAQANNLQGSNALQLLG
jgi:flagellin